MAPTLPRSLTSSFLGLALFGAATAAAQDARPVAIVHARVHTMTDAGLLENATILIRDGRIEAVGTDVDVPAGARIVDVEGGTVLPGLVQAWSEAGTGDAPAPQDEVSRRVRGRFRGMRSSGGGTPRPQNRAARKIADGLYARQDVFGELLAQGVTTLVVRPSEAGYSGLAAVLDPSASGDAESLIVDDDVYLVVEPGNDAKSKQLVAEAFDKAKALLEERKKPKPEPAEAKPEEKKPDEPKPKEEAKKDDEEKPKEGDEPKPEGGDEPKPEDDGEKKPEDAKQRPERKPKTDPNLETIADTLDDQRPVFVRITSAADVQHWLDGVGDRRFPRTVLVLDRPNPSAGRIDQATEELRKLETPVLMTPHLPTIPFTRTVVNPALELHDAGIEFGFVLPEDDRALLDLRFTLMEMVRFGLPAEAALRACTIAPARMLGLDKEVGSIAPEKRADLLVFDGDPLDPTARLRSVWVKGRETGTSE